MPNCFNPSATLAAVLGNRSTAADKPSRPDILLIMPDQMRGDCLSILGHATVSTPRLDSLAEQGTLFRRAYSTCPSCIPARYGLLTGLAPQTSGVVGYKQKPITSPTLPQVLSKAGYATVLVGRTMHQTPPDEPYGYQQWIRGLAYIADDAYDNDLKKAAPQSGGILKLIAGLGLTPNGWEAKPWPLADELHPTAWVVNQSRKIVAARLGDHPLFLTTSLLAPHPPLFPPKKYFDSCLQKKLPRRRMAIGSTGSAAPLDQGKALHRVLLEGETLHPPRPAISDRSSTSTIRLRR